MASKLVSMAEVRKQAAAKSNAAWIVVKGKVYDFTDFAKNHPGGAELLTKNNGKDATEEFVASHPEDIIARTITPEEYERMYIGDVDPATVTAADVIKYDAFAEDDGDAAAVAAAASGSVGQAGEESSNEKPTLDTCLNLYDFEAIASRTMKQAGWAYYSSGADDEITLRENHSAFHRIWLKPRVMVNVKAINMESTVLGHRTSLPLYLSAAAMCKLGHPDGECAWTRAAGSEGVIQMIPTLSSCSLEEIMDARIEGQTVFFQLYVNSNRDTCQRIVEKAERLGCTAMFITCDAPQLGNREKDRRVKVSHSGANVQQNSSKDKVATKSEGTAKALTTFIDPSLNWADIEWFRSITNMRIVLKGIATAEDALLAVEHKIPAIVLSNHGGRQLDFARSGIEILPEVMAALHARGVADQLEVFVDGGVRRGTDIFKALAMGAKAVGLSRPALYAMSAFGQPGVEKMIRILKDELEMTMRLMGTPTIADIREDMVVTTDLARHNTAIPRDFLQHETYLPKTSQAVTQKFRGRRTQNARAENYVQSGRDNAVALGGEVAALRREVRELKDLVADVARAVAVPGGGGGGGGRETRPSPFSPGTVLVLLSSVLLGLARSVFVLDSRLTIHRTALVLLAYLVVHVAGILSVFGGAEAFNANTNLVHGSRLVKVVEYYLLLAFVLHVGVALYRAYTTKVLRGVSQNPVSVFKRLYLMMSGLTLLAFVVVHLQHFRFNAALDSGRYALEGGVSAEGGGSGGGSSGMDFYRLLLDTFADGGDTMVAGYVVSVVVLGVHLYFGWTKAVHKMRLDAAHGTAQYLHPVRQLGYALTVAVTAGFVVAVLGARAAAAARGGDGN